MVYVGFSLRSHKKIANIMCKNFKHCAPIIIENENYKLYQFVDRKNISIIKIKKRDLKILEKYGWQFIRYECKPNINLLKTKYLTCVQFTKHTCGIKNITIQTPDKLFRYLSK